MIKNITFRLYKNKCRVIIEIIGYILYTLNVIVYRDSCKNKNKIKNPYMHLKLNR